MKKTSFQGIFPAAVLPFKENYEIDEINLRRFVRYLSGIDGVAGILCNGRASCMLQGASAERREDHEDKSQ